jgi:hypothetical protein
MSIISPTMIVVVIEIPIHKGVVQDVAIMYIVHVSSK